MSKRKGVPWGCNKRKGSVHRAKCKTKKPLGLYATLRCIAWPIGESEEIYIWIQCFKFAPVMMFATAVLIVIYWVLHDAPTPNSDHVSNAEIRELWGWAPLALSGVLAIPYCMLKPIGAI